MIKNIEKVFKLCETRLRYRKRETMAGLYFKEMLSKISGSENKENNNKESEKQKSYKAQENKEEIIDSSKKEHEGEGTFLDKLC